MLKTRLTARWSLTYPILNAPMALVAGGRLAAAVSAAGGLGMIGGGYAGVLGGEPALEDEITAAQGARVGLGFIGWALAQSPHMLEIAIAARPAAVFLSFADPKQFAPSLQAAKIPLICQVQTLRQAESALDAGATAIVAQGTEAGGHGGARATFPFVPEVADLIVRRSPDTLLLAAGGIADGRGLAAALLLGADGVVVGSRFWAAVEALTPTGAVARGLDATGDNTVRTTAIDSLRGVPWPSEYSFRVVENAFTKSWAAREHEAAQQPAAMREAFQHARERGDWDTLPIVAGEAVGLINRRDEAATIVRDIGTQAAALLSRSDPLDRRR